MSPLKARLIKQITQMGPIALSDYMAQCLLDPEFGYYINKNPFGGQGDFITAPEISQMFGELIGLGLAQYWLDIGAPDPFVLAELGPGTGTLMSDLLRATKLVPGFQQAARISLIEAAPAMRARQKAQLHAYDIAWHADLSQIEDYPLFLVANEFFDALPIRQFMRTLSGWSETMIGLQEGDLIFGRGPQCPPALLTGKWDITAPDDIIETSAASVAIAQEIGLKISKRGGLALIIDYGDIGGKNDTFQAMQNHTYVDALQNPGQADLTAHVDFAALVAASQPAVGFVMQQGTWLLSLGIEARAQRLAQNLKGAGLKNHWAAMKRLTDPTGMGNLFKVLALTAPKAPLAPGFV